MREDAFFPCRNRRNTKDIRDSRLCYDRFLKKRLDVVVIFTTERKCLDFLKIIKMSTIWSPLNYTVSVWVFFCSACQSHLNKYSTPLCHRTRNWICDLPLEQLLCEGPCMVAAAARCSWPTLYLNWLARPQVTTVNITLEFWCSWIILDTLLKRCYKTRPMMSPNYFYKIILVLFYNNLSSIFHTYLRKRVLCKTFRIPFWSGSVPFFKENPQNFDNLSDKGLLK